MPLKKLTLSILARKGTNLSTELRRQNQIYPQDDPITKTGYHQTTPKTKPQRPHNTNRPPKHRPIQKLQTRPKNLQKLPNHSQRRHNPKPPNNQRKPKRIRQQHKTRHQTPSTTRPIMLLRRTQ